MPVVAVAVGSLLLGAMSMTSSGAATDLPSVRVYNEVWRDQLSSGGPRVETFLIEYIWTDRDLVFTTELGGPVADQALRCGFHRHLAAAGCPRIRIHDGRHTAASILLGRGVNPKIVSELLGHSRISTTMDLYSHVTPTMQRAAIVEMEKALGGGA
jgi:integrase